MRQSLPSLCARLWCTRFHHECPPQRAGGAIARQLRGKIVGTPRTGPWVTVGLVLGPGFAQGTAGDASVLPRTTGTPCARAALSTLKAGSSPLCSAGPCGLTRGVAPQADGCRVTFTGCAPSGLIGDDRAASAPPRRGTGGPPGGRRVRPRASGCRGRRWPPPGLGRGLGYGPLGGPWPAGGQ